MSRNYAHIAQRDSITVHFDDGTHYIWPRGHANFDDVKASLARGDSADVVRGLMDTVGKVREAIKSATTATDGSVTVTRDGVMYRGRKLELPIADRIMDHVAENYPVEPVLRFTERLLKNQRREAVESLYDFLAKNNIPITEDGHFIVYKKVRSDYKDIHSGTFDNSVGAKPRVEAWEVDANRDQTCAKGLHVCARQYLPSFRSYDSKGDRVVVCKVDPADVVAVPRDYNHSKMRVCAYEVISELSEEQAAEALDKHRVVTTETTVEGVSEWNDGAFSPVQSYEGEPEDDDTCECGKSWDFCDNNPCPEDEDEDEVDQDDDDNGPPPSDPASPAYNGPSLADEPVKSPSGFWWFRRK